MRSIDRILRSRLFSNLNSRYLAFVIPSGLLVIALFSRLYDLSSFPYFPNGWPMCGGFSCLNTTVQTPSLPGLYADEMVDFLASNSIRNIVSNIGGGPVAALLIALSTHLFGITVFAIRLPFGIMSAFSAVAVYFTTKAIAGNKTSAILSSLFFVFMMPALVYGRMAFGETVIALLFITVVFCTMKIHNVSQPNGMWSLLATLCCILSIIVKLNGIIVPIYFLLFMFRYKILGREIRNIGLILAFGVFLPFGLLLLFSNLPVTLLFNNMAKRWILGMGNALNVPKFLLFDTLPSSGAPLYWGTRRG